RRREHERTPSGLDEAARIRRTEAGGRPEWGGVGLEVGGRPLGQGSERSFGRRSGLQIGRRSANLERIGQSGARGVGNLIPARSRSTPSSAWHYVLTHTRSTDQ